MRERLDPLIAATKADEVMVTTMVYDHGARRRSYELIAEAFGLPSIGMTAHAGSCFARSKPGNCAVREAGHPIRPGQTCNRRFRLG